MSKMLDEQFLEVLVDISSSEYLTEVLLVYPACWRYPCVSLILFLMKSKE